MAVRSAGANPTLQPPGGTPPPSGIPNEQRDALFAQLASSNLRDQSLGIEYARTLFAQGSGATEADLYAFEQALASGPNRLADNPVGYLALGSAWADRGRPDRARTALDTATRLAGDASLQGSKFNGVTGRFEMNAQGRAQASRVNGWAAPVYARIGDLREAERRMLVGRLYSATDFHRVARHPVYKAPPAFGQPETSHKRQPTMGPPTYKPPVPPELSGSSGSRPTVPPKMDAKPKTRASGPGGVLGLIETLSTWIGAGKKMNANAIYQEAAESARRHRDFYPVPPRPDELRTIYNTLRTKAASGSPDEREAAAIFLDRVDFEFLTEASRAYWGRQ